MKSIQEIKLENAVSDILMDFAGIAMENISTSDLQGIAVVKAMKIIELVKKDMSLNRKIERLVLMQKLFNYWHVAHLPFAVIMIIIMIIHVAVTITFGYKWIF